MAHAPSRLFGLFDELRKADRVEHLLLCPFVSPLPSLVVARPSSLDVYDVCFPPVEAPEPEPREPAAGAGGYSGGSLLPPPASASGEKPPNFEKAVPTPVLSLRCSTPLAAVPLAVSVIPGASAASKGFQARSVGGNAFLDSTPFSSFLPFSPSLCPPLFSHVFPGPSPGLPSPGASSSTFPAGDAGRPPAQGARHKGPGPASSLSPFASAPAPGSFSPVADACCSLLLVFPNYQLATCVYDPFFNCIRTSTLHCFQRTLAPLAAAVSQLYVDLYLPKDQRGGATWGEGEAGRSKGPLGPQRALAGRDEALGGSRPFETEPWTGSGASRAVQGAKEPEKEDQAMVQLSQMPLDWARLWTHVCVFSEQDTMGKDARDETNGGTGDTLVVVSIDPIHLVVLELALPPRSLQTVSAFSEENARKRTSKSSESRETGSEREAKDTEEGPQGDLRSSHKADVESTDEAQTSATDLGAWKEGAGGDVCQRGTAKGLETSGNAETGFGPRPHGSLDPSSFFASPMAPSVPHAPEASPWSRGGPLAGRGSPGFPAEGLMSFATFSPSPLAPAPCGFAPHTFAQEPQDGSATGGVEPAGASTGPYGPAAASAHSRPQEEPEDLSGSAVGAQAVPDWVWGDHRVMVGGACVRSCWHISLLEDLPATVCSASTLKAPSHSSPAPLGASARKQGSLVGLRRVAPAPEGPGGSQAHVGELSAGRIIEMKKVAGRMLPTLALLVEVGALELGGIYGELDRGNRRGEKELMVVVLAIIPELREFQVMRKIQGILPDSFSLVPLPASLGGDLLCVSPDTVSVLRIREGAGDPASSLSGAAAAASLARGEDPTRAPRRGLLFPEDEDEDSRASRIDERHFEDDEGEALREEDLLLKAIRRGAGRNGGLTQVVNSAGLQRSELKDLPTVIFDQSEIQADLGGAVAHMIGDQCCLFVLKNSGRLLLAHFVSPTPNVGVTDIFWSSPLISLPSPSRLPPPAFSPSLLDVFPSQTVASCYLSPASLSSLAPALEPAPSSPESPGSPGFAVALGGCPQAASGLSLLVFSPTSLETTRPPSRVSPFSLYLRRFDDSAGRVVWRREGEEPQVETRGFSVGAGWTLLGASTRKPRAARGVEDPEEDTGRQLFTLDGKELLEIDPRGDVQLARQEAPILRLEEECEKWRLRDEGDNMRPSGALEGSLCLPDHGVSAGLANRLSPGACQTDSRTAPRNPGRFLRWLCMRPTTPQRQQTPSTWTGSPVQEDVELALAETLATEAGRDGPWVLPSFNVALVDFLCMPRSGAVRDFAEFPPHISFEALLATPSPQASYPSLPAPTAKPASENGIPPPPPPPPPPPASSSSGQVATSSPCFHSAAGLLNTWGSTTWLAALGLRQFGRIVFSQRAVPSVSKLAASLRSDYLAPLGALWALEAFPLRSRPTRDAGEGGEEHPRWGRRRGPRGPGGPKHRLLLATSNPQDRRHPGRTVVCQISPKFLREEERAPDEGELEIFQAPVLPGVRGNPRSPLTLSGSRQTAFCLAKATVGCGTMCDGLLVFQVATDEMRVVAGLMPSLLIGALPAASWGAAESHMQSPAKTRASNDLGPESEVPKASLVAGDGSQKPGVAAPAHSATSGVAAIQARVCEPFIVALDSDFRFSLWRLNRSVAATLCEELLQVYSDHQQQQALLEGLDEQERTNLSFSAAEPSLSSPPEIERLLPQVPAKLLPTSLRRAKVKSLQLFPFQRMSACAARGDEAVKDELAGRGCGGQSPETDANAENPAGEHGGNQKARQPLTSSLGRANRQQDTSGNGTVLLCAVTLQRGMQVLQIVDLFSMSVLFYSTGLLLVPPVLRNVGLSCFGSKGLGVSRQVREACSDAARALSSPSADPHPDRAQGSVAALQRGRVSFRRALAGAPETAWQRQGRQVKPEPPEETETLPRDAAMEAREDAGVRFPDGWVYHEEEAERAPKRHCSGGEEPGEEPDAAESLWASPLLLSDCIEEVLGAELVDLSPRGEAGERTNEDHGPTLVVFITGRPVLIYRAFSFSLGQAVDSKKRDSVRSPSSAAGTPGASPGLEHFFPEAHPRFPFRFSLVVHDVADPIPSHLPPTFSGLSPLQSSPQASLQASPLSALAGAERGAGVALAEPQFSSGAVVPFEGIRGSGSGAFIVPPCRSKLAPGDAHAEAFEENQGPPVLWIFSERNELFVHPHARRDVIAVAPFNNEASPESFFSLTSESCLELSDLLFSPTLDFLAADSMGSPFPEVELRAPWPCRTVPVHFSPCRVCVSSGGSYLHPSTARKPQSSPFARPFDARVKTPHTPQGPSAVLPFPSDISTLLRSSLASSAPPRGRLFAVAGWHDVEENPMVAECLAERNALQLEQLELEGRRKRGEDLRADDSQEEIAPNPYLVACTDKRVEAAGKLGKLYEVRLYHEFDLHKPVGTYTLRTCEEVLSLSFVVLDGIEHLAAGVGVPLSENVECGGRVYLFKLPESSLRFVPAGNASEAPTEEAEFGTPARLELFADIVLNGPVTVVGSFFSSPAERSYVVHSVGPRLFVHEMEGSKFLRGAFSDSSVCVTSVANIRNFFLLGDALKGLNLVSWEYHAEADSRKMIRVSRTFPKSNLPVVACSFLTYENLLGMLATDIDGNVRLFCYNADKNAPGFEKLDILQCDAEDRCAAGCVVKLQQFVVDSETVASLGEAADSSTLVFRLLASDSYSFLQTLQDRMAQYLPEPLGLFPPAGRLPVGDVSVWTKWNVRSSSLVSDADDRVWVTRKRMLDTTLLKVFPFLSLPVLAGLLSPYISRGRRRAGEPATKGEASVPTDATAAAQGEAFVEAAEEAESSVFSKFDSLASLRQFLVASGALEGAYTRLLV
ncbi:UNVERIFIED_CONTAM: CPSF A subunit region protein [Hammondia hammondi]|eukprot:XP_008881814.1 CPSF A subunit region protein [Hammondia hammondi]